jgi:predicted dehydrogenase
VSIVEVGLCGHGYWDQNLLRTFSSDPRFEVVAVSDVRENARDRGRRTNSTIRLYGDGTEVIDDPEIEAVAIATPPPPTSLARRALVRN